MLSYCLKLVSKSPRIIKKNKEKIFFFKNLWFATVKDRDISKKRKLVDYEVT